MLYKYPNASRLPQLHACERVFDRLVVVVEYEPYCCTWNSKTHGIPSIRTRQLNSLGHADAFFIIDPELFTDLEEFIAERGDTCAIHLLGKICPPVSRNFLEIS